MADTLARIREICLALPEVEWKRSGKHATFRVRKRTFAYYLVDHQGNEGIVGAVFKAPKGESESLLDSDPNRFYRPAYLHHRGWVGLRLDTGDVDWPEVAHYVEDSYMQVAPKRLAALVDEEV